MRPSRSAGAKTALRAPMITRASPRRILRHSSYRSPALSRLCSTAETSPKRARNQRTICGVSAISGTRMIALLPRRSVCRTALRKTSVLPLPVTPCSRKRPPPFSSVGRISSRASCCISVSGCHCSLSSGSPSPGVRRLSSSVRRISPASRRAFRASRGSRTSSAISVTRRGEDAISSRRISRRFGLRLSFSRASSASARGTASAASSTVRTLTRPPRISAGSISRSVSASGQWAFSAISSASSIIAGRMAG